MDTQKLLAAQLRRDITDLYKAQINCLEDLKSEHNSMLARLQDSLPNSAFPLLLAADYFSEQKFSQMRKRILDAGNDAIRNMEEKIKQLTD